MKEIIEKLYQQLDEALKLENTNNKLKGQYDDLVNDENELNKSLSELNDNLSSVQNQILNEESRIEELTKLKERLENAKHEKFLAKIFSVSPILILLLMNLVFAGSLIPLEYLEHFYIGVALSPLISALVYFSQTIEIRRLIKEHKLEDVNTELEEIEEKHDKSMTTCNDLCTTKGQILNKHIKNVEKGKEIQIMLDELKTKKEEIISQLLITFQNSQSTNDSINQEDPLSDNGPCKKIHQ
jgi:uncharacterized coiled-coil DUF342 family protein